MIMSQITIKLDKYLKKDQSESHLGENDDILRHVVNGSGVRDSFAETCPHRMTIRCHDWMRPNNSLQTINFRSSDTSVYCQVSRLVERLHPDFCVEYIKYLHVNGWKIFLNKFKINIVVHVTFEWTFSI